MRCFPVICADYETALSLFSIVYLFSRTQQVEYLYLFPSCQVGSTTDCQKFYSVDTAQTIPPFPAALISDPLQIYKGAQLNWTKRHFWKYNSAAGLAALNLQDPWNLFLAGSDNILISFVLQAEPKY